MSYEFLRETRTYLLRYLERVPLGTTYPGVRIVCELVADGGEVRACTLVVDATGVGAPVVDLLRAAGIGDAVGGGDDYGVGWGDSRERMGIGGCRSGTW